VTHVPSVAELVHLRLATARTVKGIGTVYHVSDAGHRLMGEAMRANALDAIANGESAWTPPPPSLDVPLSVLLHPEGTE
jgi:hypothetical protein